MAIREPSGPTISTKPAILAAYLAEFPGRSITYLDPFAPCAAPVQRTKRSREAARTQRPADAADEAAAKRVNAQAAAAILGLKPRKLQAMSARGAIPGAARIGRQWSYDPAKLRRYLKHCEREVCQASAGRPKQAKRER
jgi:hypothetical protein